LLPRFVPFFFEDTIVACVVVTSFEVDDEENKEELVSTKFGLEPLLTTSDARFDGDNGKRFERRNFELDGGVEGTALSLLTLIEGEQGEG
jgi:hypothetical protein